MRITRVYILRFLILLLPAVCQSAPSGMERLSDSARAVIDGIIARMRAADRSDSGINSMILLSDSVGALATTHFGANDTAIAVAFGLRGWALLWRGSDAAAESSLVQAIRIWQNSQGPGCPQQVGPMRVLGDLYHFVHREVESEKTFLRAIEILKEAPPYRGSWTTGWMLALLHNNLASVYERQGRLEGARQYYEEALRLWTKESGRGSSDVAVAHINLGSVALDMGDYVAADKNLRLALDIFEKSPSEALGQSTNADCARLTLALACLHLGRDDEARSLFNRAMVGYTQVYGRQSRGMLAAIEVGVSIEMASGNWAKAAEFSEQEVQIVERTDARNTADLSDYLLDLAQCQFQLGDSERCLATFDRASSFRQSFIEGAFSYASEKSKLLYLRQFPIISSAHISFAVESRKPDAVASALQTVLFGKARILDALSEERHIAFCSETPETRLLVARYAEVCDDIAELAVSAREGTVSDETSSLYKLKDSLELALSHQCAEFDSLLQMRSVSVAEVASGLPLKGVLWEYFQYRPFCFGHPDSVLPPRYLAFTLNANGGRMIADLGEAHAIDSLVWLVHQEIQRGVDVFMGEDEHGLEKQLADVTSRLYELVLAPLEKSATIDAQVFISPDGQLSLLPFEILPLPDGRYAIEQYEFTYLSSGRDLLEHPEKHPGQVSGAIVVAAPDYDIEQPQSYAQVDPGFGRAVLDRFRGPSDRTGCLSVPFNQLPGAEKEGQMVSDLFKVGLRDSVVLLRGQNASEDSLKHLSHPPRVLHLATHGYFCSNASYSDVSKMTESPLLYSGLALAGSNRTIENPGNTPKMTEDGILTALEVSGLNLMGTDLVVLGSCRAGVGPVLQGEGVYGLRRAFQLAGARSVIMSMFDVPDMTARDLMTRFYTDWLSGTTKSKALRNAMLAELKQRRQQHGAAHPLFWGGFILAGNPM